ncbi:hypothetical protein BJ508DRAFT_336402 [Ascobolus immersus RN42]|uniref:SnoaL-like domain-containing protein n=1 Tax=Ascobolus immersus RN42 TaxID=1160509 RepID=A0A3N4HG52_ASCIM|nr:hypothetical protein BJ508DRAFT_336402 [Ascobolus immersus RN42]
MKLAFAAVLVSAIAPLVASTPVASTSQPEQSLEEWWKVVPWTIFPNNSNWEAGFNAAFAPDVKATFNRVDHDYNSLKQFFGGVYSVISKNYDFLSITPLDVVVLPNPNDKGGIVVMTGREEGALKGSDTVRVERDAVFAVVKEINGERRFTEWREVTNFF